MGFDVFSLFVSLTFCAAACLDFQRVPEHDWHCPDCKDKFDPGKKTAAGESTNIARPIVIRLTRVVKAPGFDIGGCVVCRLVGHFFKVNFSNLEFIFVNFGML